MRSYRFEAFQVSMTPAAGAPYPDLSALFDAVIATPSIGIQTVDGVMRELRGLQVVSDPIGYACIVRKFRVDDVPTVGAPGEDEVLVEVPENGGFVERNFFLYVPAYRLLLWQANHHATSIRAFGRMIQQIARTTVEIDPVLTPEAASALMSSSRLMKSFTVRVARPTNVKYYPKSDWGRDILRALKTGGGDAITIKASTDGRKPPSAQNRLKTAFLVGVKELMRESFVSSAKVVFDEGGVEHPVDLFADRVKTTVSIDYTGRNPPFNMMLGAALEAWRNVDDMVEQVLGSGQDSIRG